MGTNFYTKTNVCQHCGRGDHGLHIGKSSAGWVFSLNTHPEEGVRSLEDWIRLWLTPGVEIRDEYGEKIETLEMLQRILSRSAGPGQKLLRSSIDGHRVLDHPDESYDLAHGDFS